MQDIVIRGLAVIVIITMVPIVIAVALVATTLAFVLFAFIALFAGIIYMGARAYMVGERVCHWFNTTAGVK